MFSTALLSSHLPAITAQFESLKPSFTRLDRLESLVARARRDMDSLGQFQYWVVCSL